MPTTSISRKRYGASSPRWHEAAGREGSSGYDFSHELVHLIGGQDDTNSNTTRRILLLSNPWPLDREQPRARHHRHAQPLLARRAHFARGSKPINVPSSCSTISPATGGRWLSTSPTSREPATGKAARSGTSKLRMSRKLIRFWSAVVFQLPAGMARVGGHAGAQARRGMRDMSARLHGPQAARHLRADAWYLAEKNPAKAAQIFAFAEKRDASTSSSRFWLTHTSGSV